MEYYEIPELSNRDIRRLARRSLRGRWLKALLPMLIITLALVLPALVQYWELLSSGMLYRDNVPQDFSTIMEQLGSMKSGWFSNILSLFSFLCTGAFSLAAAALSVRILRNESFDTGTAFTGFRQFVQAFLIDLLTSIFSMLWSLITILPATVILMFCLQSGLLSIVGAVVFAVAVLGYILLILRYSMAFFIAQDNDRLPSLDAVRYSVTLMKGRAPKYFSLQLSFMAWIILAVIPVSAGMVFLTASSDTGSVLLKMIAACLIAVGFVTVAMVKLYLNTSNAVFYSAVSGNFGISGESVSEPEASDSAGTAEDMLPDPDPDPESVPEPGTDDNEEVSNEEVSEE